MPGWVSGGGGEGREEGKKEIIWVQICVSIAWMCVMNRSQPWLSFCSQVLALWDRVSQWPGFCQLQTLVWLASIPQRTFFFPIFISLSISYLHFNCYSPSWFPGLLSHLLNTGFTGHSRILSFLVESWRPKSGPHPAWQALCWAHNF